jgi:predicted transglutaminase-like cysteine proteinase
MILTGERWDELNKIQSDVNCDVKYTSDMKLYGKPEFWEIADDRGDCDDYALAKRERLSELGWSKLDDLAIALCWTELGSYHAVLVAKTDRGDFVLDNRYQRVRAWKDLPYKWDRIQDGKKWKSAGDRVRVKSDKVK